MTPKNFLELGMAETAGDGSGFFVGNRLVKVCAGLDNFNIASELEKTSLLRYVISPVPRCSLHSKLLGY